MEKFQQIDWTNNVEDIVDEKFIDEERLKKESAMYKILNGHFHDPFQGFRPFVNKQQESKKLPEKPKPKNDKPSLGVAVAGSAIKKRGRPRKKVDN